MSSISSLATVAIEVAEDQWGLLTRTQALSAGVPRATFARLASAGALIRVAHGVYRVAGGTVRRDHALRRGQHRAGTGVDERGADRLPRDEIATRMEYTWNSDAAHDPFAKTYGLA